MKPESEVSFWERRPVDVHRTCDSSCCVRRSSPLVILQRCGKPCVIFAHWCPERYAGLLKLKNSLDPPTSRLRPRPTSLAPKSIRSKLASTLEVFLSLCSNEICGQLKPDRTSSADVCDSDQRVVLQTGRDASWRDPPTRHGLFCDSAE